MEEAPRQAPSTLYNGTLLRQTILAAILFGIGLVFLINGRAPGWQPFALVSALAVVSLFLTVLSLRGNNYVVLLTFTVLLLAIFWKPGEPWAAMVGTILVLLNAFKMARQDQAESELILAESEPQPVEQPQDYVGL